MSGPEDRYYLNLGCGSRFLAGWINLDLAPVDPQVQACDLLNGFPFPDNSFRFVYHSHLLEHIPRPKASGFLSECYRVLKPGCVMRVVVPDLEQITCLYLQYLDESIQGNKDARSKYHWMLLELLDQLVRNHSGGEMSTYLLQDPLPEKTFILQRMGGEAQRIYAAHPAEARTWRLLPLVSFVRQARMLTHYARDKIYRIILGRRDFQALLTGRFRQSGEIHQWMYDRYSLAQALLQAGFYNPRQQTAFTSLFPGWTDANLDIGPDGTVYKPDSLFMEAVKPA